MITGFRSQGVLFSRFSHGVGLWEAPWVYVYERGKACQHVLMGKQRGPPFYNSAVREIKCRIFAYYFPAHFIKEMEDRS